MQLNGKAENLWDMDDPQQADSLSETCGTLRYWQLDITSWQESTLPYRFTWELLDESPHIPKLKRYSNFNDTISLRVERIQQETDRLKSLRLRASEGIDLPEFLAGSHLQFMVKLPDGSEVKRHYSLINNSNNRSSYEIGVLRESEGRGSSHYMHEQVNEGDVLEIRLSKNEF